MNRVAPAALRHFESRVGRAVSSLSHSLSRISSGGCTGSRSIPTRSHDYLPTNQHCTASLHVCSTQLRAGIISLRSIHAQALSEAVPHRRFRTHTRTQARTYIRKMATSVAPPSIYGVGARRLLPAEVIPMPKEPFEIAKRLAARQAVDECVCEGMRVGVGSGSTIVYAIQRLAERVHNDGLHIICVPTSFQSRQLIVDTGLALSDLSVTPELDIAIDGADEVDPWLNCIKGGGACQTQEKLVAAAAKRFVIVADHRKCSKVLGTEWRKGVPVEVLAMGYVPVMRKFTAMGGKPVLRMAVNKAGPVVTDNGNFVVDVDFGAIADPAALHQQMKLIPGVVETGLFIKMADKAYFGKADGTVDIWTPAAPDAHL